MAVSISFINDNNKLTDAVRIANAIMSNPKLYTLIKERTLPFDNCRPVNLQPAAVADLFEACTLRPFLRSFRGEDGVGGRFIKKYPKVIWVNLRIVAASQIDVLVALLVHMCVQVASANEKNCLFTHDNEEAKYNLDTAPYYIQKLVKAHFGRNTNELMAEALMDVEVYDHIPRDYSFRKYN